MRTRVCCFLLALLAWSQPTLAVTPLSTAYVELNGSDANPCTRTAACKTISRALSVVAAGRQVDVVDSGSYDMFTVSKSVIVRADAGVVATINVPASGTGITVTAPNDTVALVGLTLQGTSESGVGIQINDVGRITVDDCVSRGFAYGLSYTGSHSGGLKVTGGTFEGSDTGIFIVSAGRASVDRATVYGGSHHAGIDAASAQVTITRTLITGDDTSLGSGVQVNGSGPTVLENNVITGYAAGVYIFASGVTAVLSSNTITGNNYGILNGGTVYTRGNNTIFQNGANLSGNPLTRFSAM